MGLGMANVEGVPEMKIKTSELIGPALDWVVACIKGSKYGVVCFDPKTKRVYETEGLRQVGVNWSPSTNWAQGGPLIEREWLDITPWPNEADEYYRWTCVQHDTPNLSLMQGPTPLIAAMRCLVASRLSDEVDIPEELAP